MLICPTLFVAQHDMEPALPWSPPWHCCFSDLWILEGVGPRSSVCTACPVDCTEYCCCLGAQGWSHPVCPLLSSPPPPSHQCTPPGRASASAVVSPHHAAGSSGGPCHSGASRRHSAPLLAGRRWGSSRSRAPAPSPHSLRADGSWPASPQSTPGNGWPGPTSTVPPATGHQMPKVPSRMELLPHHLHAPWQSRHLHAILCPRVCSPLLPSPLSVVQLLITFYFNSRF